MNSGERQCPVTIVVSLSCSRMGPWGASQACKPTLTAQAQTKGCLMKYGPPPLLDTILLVGMRAGLCVCVTLQLPTKGLKTMKLVCHAIQPHFCAPFRFHYLAPPPLWIFAGDAAASKIQRPLRWPHCPYTATYNKGCRGLWASDWIGQWFSKGPCGSVGLGIGHGDHVATHVAPSVSEPIVGKCG